MRMHPLVPFEIVKGSPALLLALVRGKDTEVRKERGVGGWEGGSCVAHIRVRQGRGFSLVSWSRLAHTHFFHARSGHRALDRQIGNKIGARDHITRFLSQKKSPRRRVL